MKTVCTWRGILSLRDPAALSGRPGHPIGLTTIRAETAYYKGMGRSSSRYSAFSVDAEAEHHDVSSSAGEIGGNRRPFETPRRARGQQALPRPHQIQRI